MKIIKYQNSIVPKPKEAPDIFCIFETLRLAAVDIGDNYFNNSDVYYFDVACGQSERERLVVTDKNRDGYIDEVDLADLANYNDILGTGYSRINMAVRRFHNLLPDLIKEALMVMSIYNECDLIEEWANDSKKIDLELRLSLGDKWMSIHDLDGDGKTDRLTLYNYTAAPIDISANCLYSPEKNSYICNMLRSGTEQYLQPFDEFWQ